MKRYISSTIDGRNNDLASLLLGLFIVFILFACNGSKSVEQDAIDKNRMGVEGYVVAESRFTNIIKGHGKIGVKQKVSVSSPRDELIKRIYYEEGDYVKKGAILFRLETVSISIQKEQLVAEKLEAEQKLKIAKIQYQEALYGVEKRILQFERFNNEIDIAEMNFSNTTRELLRKKKFYEIGDIPKEELISFQTKSYLNEKKKLDIMYKDQEIKLIGLRDEDIVSAGFKVPLKISERNNILKKINTRMESATVEGAKMRVKNAILKIKSIDEMIRKSIVRSPISGDVAVRAFNQGEKADRTKPVFVIVDIKEVYIVAELPEVQYPHVVTGDTISFGLDSVSKEMYQTKLSIVSPIVNDDTGSFQIKGLYKNRNGRLKPGMFVYLDIISKSSSKCIMVPSRFICNIQNKTGDVFVYRNGLSKKINIFFEKKIDDRYIIQDGIDVGDILLYSEKRPLFDDAEVKIIKRGKNES